MSDYKHLCAEERDRIAELKAIGLGVNAIACDLGSDKSTITRQLRRNGQDGGLAKCRINCKRMDLQIKMTELLGMLVRLTPSPSRVRCCVGGSNLQ